MKLIFSIFFYTFTSIVIPFYIFSFYSHDNSRHYYFYALLSLHIYFIFIFAIFLFQVIIILCERTLQCHVQHFRSRPWHSSRCQGCKRGWEIKNNKWWVFYIYFIYFVLYSSFYFISFFFLISLIFFIISYFFLFYSFYFVLFFFPHFIYFFFSGLMSLVESTNEDFELFPLLQILTGKNPPKEKTRNLNK